MKNTLQINEIVINKEFKNILVIEDSLLINKIIEKYLKKEKYNVIFASNVFEALSIIEIVDIDIILLDIMMPVITGYTFLKLVKCRKSTMHIPIIIVSSLDNEFDITKGLSMGAISYITKPFKAVDLKLQIGKALLN